jgi:S1-C subfamily serine protease
MSHVKKSSLLITIVIVIALGIVGQNIIGNYYSPPASMNSQAAGSVVYIENGVTGVVTINDPYLNRTTDINVIYAPLDSGSGFIVNNEGYIVTAFHVVADPKTVISTGKLRLMDSTDIKLYIERAAVTGYISRYNPQLGSELVSSNVTGNPPLITIQPNTNSTTDLLVQRNLINVQSANQQIRVKLPGTRSNNPLNANLVDVGTSGTEDVAILKIDSTFKKLIPLTINSKSPVIGEKLQIYGYPGLNDNTYSDFNQTIIKPTVSTGVFTSSVSQNGTTYYETSAKTVQGYSGGPVVDSNSNVMGIIIYSVEDPLDNQQTSISSLFLSSQYIIKICEKNNIPISIV